jgi:acetyl coenzyme A synthetase (ADP forming)-like protein
MDKFFKPKSVAIVGASRSPKKVGHVIFRNFIEGGFAGKVYPINPNTEDLFGHKCYSSVSRVKGRIDLAVIAIPAPIVPAVLKQCGKKGIHAAIIVSGGFKEIGRKDIEDEIQRVAKKYRIRIIGPNCLGVYDAHSCVDTIFNPRYKLERPEEGRIGLMSQSGATMSVLLDWMAMKGYKASKFISYGNATDIDEADLAEYLAGDDETSVICIYFEGVRRGRKFYETVKKLSGKIPIIALKGGVTPAGHKAVSSHTGNLAGESVIYSAAFKQAGIIEARDLEQIFDFARVLSTQPVSKGKRVQIVTDGGGFGVLATDWVYKNGLELAQMQKSNCKMLEKLTPDHAVISNPIDLTGDATTEMYEKVINTALHDKNVDMIVVVALFQPPLLTADVTDVISDAGRKRKKPIVVVSAGGRYTEVLKKSLEDSDVPCFSYPERAVSALKALYDYGRKKNGRAARKNKK